MAPNPARIIAAMPATVPFVGPEVIERRSGKPFRARLGANESGFGPSPNVISAIAQAAGGIWTYGDSEVFALRDALAAHIGIARQAITVGEGIDGLLGLTCRLFLEEGDRVVTSLGAYPTFNYHVAAQGAELVTVPYENDRESLSGLLDAVRKARPKIVYLANPDNPMGTWWAADDVAAFIAAVPEETLIVLDEAYGETAPEGTLPPAGLSRPNLLRFRTFSKAYGMAGLRVAYAFGLPETVSLFDRIRNHFGVTKLGQHAALVALADQDYVAGVVAAIGNGRAALAGAAADMGLQPVPSATNFLAIDCGGRERAEAILEKLIERQIFVRKPMAPGLDRCIRLSIGKPEDMALATEVLRDVVASI